MRLIAKSAMLAIMTTDAIVPMGAAEACDALGVSRDTLIRMIAAGKITKAVKLSGEMGQWVCDRPEIEALATARVA